MTRLKPGRRSRNCSFSSTDTRTARCCPKETAAAGGEGRLSDADLLVANFYSSIRLYAAAEPRYRHILTTDPEFTRKDALYFRLADALEKSDKKSEALPYYERLVTSSSKASISKRQGWRIDRLKLELELDARQSDKPRHQESLCRSLTSACALYVCLTTVQNAAQHLRLLLSIPSSCSRRRVHSTTSLAPRTCAGKRDRKVEPQLRVIGVQDPAIRELLGSGRYLVINGGSNAGLEPWQRFFVRRTIAAVTTTGPTPRGTIHTSGWIRILGVDTMVSTATVLHACDGILFDDYLEPFVSPMIAARPLPGSTPQYDNMGHIVTGIEGLHNAAPGNVMTIDRGSNSGVVLGQRYIVFRDKREQRLDMTGRSKAFAAVANNRAGRGGEVRSCRAGRHAPVRLPPPRCDRKGDLTRQKKLVAVPVVVSSW